MEQYRNGLVNYICDKCGRGKMITYAQTLCLKRRKFLYASKCDECGFEYDMLRRYPQKIEDLYD